MPKQPRARQQQQQSLQNIGLYLKSDFWIHLREEAGRRWGAHENTVSITATPFLPWYFLYFSIYNYNETYYFFYNKYNKFQKKSWYIYSFPALSMDAHLRDIKPLIIFWLISIFH